MPVVSAGYVRLIRAYLRGGRRWTWSSRARFPSAENVLRAGKVDMAQSVSRERSRQLPSQSG
eukprot:468255-Pyramimonas_sp.AAC.1